jgi:hypothetical protein
MVIGHSGVDVQCDDGEDYCRWRKQYDGSYTVSFSLNGSAMGWSVQPSVVGLSGRGNELENIFKMSTRLKRLLLLVHEISRQPACRTEVLNLRYTNTSDNHYHIISIEKGLLVTVTSHHMNHNVTGTLKMIHSYLPTEVSKLLVYYIWLVLPFEQLRVAHLPRISGWFWY